MGVIKGRKNFPDLIAEVEDDPLSDLIESGDDSRFAHDLLTLEHTTRRRRKTRRSHALSSLGDVEGLSSRHAGQKSQRKQRRIQNEKQLRATWCSDGDLNEISIYDFIQDSVSVFTLMIQEKDNIALWNAMLMAEPEDDEDYEQLKNNSRSGKPTCTSQAFSPEVCYSRLDSYMKRTLKRQRCPTDLLRRIERDLENFFCASPCHVYKTHLDNSFSRLLLHAACEYMNLHSRSFDYMGTRWTLVKNPDDSFVRPLTPLSKYLETRRKNR